MIGHIVEPYNVSSRILVFYHLIYLMYLNGGNVVLTPEY